MLRIDDPTRIRKARKIWHVVILLLLLWQNVPLAAAQTPAPTSSVESTAEPTAEPTTEPTIEPTAITSEPAPEATAIPTAPLPETTPISATAEPAPGATPAGPSAPPLETGGLNPAASLAGTAEDFPCEAMYELRMGFLSAERAAAQPGNPGLARCTLSVDRGASKRVELASLPLGGGSPAAQSLLVAPSHGSATLVSGSLIYTPTAGFSGVDTLRYGVAPNVAGEIRFLVREPIAPVTTTAPPINQTAPAGSNALLVAKLPLGAGDQAVRARLEAAGIAVTVKDYRSVVAGDAAGQDLIVISATVLSAAMNASFRDTAVPLVTWEHALYDDLALTGASPGADYGLSVPRQRIEIAAPAHPAAAGLSGVVDVLAAPASLPYGAPAPAATRVATLPWTTVSPLFVYEAGAAMVGRTAPARRAAFFFENTSPTSATSAGWRLFDATILWALGTPGGNTPPTAAAGALTTSQNTPASLNLAALASDADGDPLSYGISVAPQHGAASIAGSTLAYTPTAGYTGADQLTYAVSDGRGGSASAAITITVTGPGDPPLVTLVASPLTGTFPLTVVFTGTYATTSGGTLGAVLDFDDLDGATATATATGSGTAVFTHTYATSAGVFTPTLRVSDQGGRVGVASQVITVNSPGPNANPELVLRSTAITGTAPLSVRFTGEAEDADGDPLSFRWDFGDSVVATGTGIVTNTAELPGTGIITHTYMRTGVFTASLIVADGRGGSAVRRMRITVEGLAPIIADASMYLDDQQTSASLDMAPLVVDIDDDLIGLEVVGQPAHGTARMVGSRLEYTRSGGYYGVDRITVQARDAAGGTDLGTVWVVDRRISLQVTPGSVVLTGAGQSALLTVVAYDSQGQQIPLSQLNLPLEWKISHANPVTGTSSLTMAPVAGRTDQVRVTSTSDLGAGLIAVRSQADPSLMAPVVPVIVGELQAGVTMLPASQVVFPAKGVSRFSNPFQTGPGGEYYAGPFRASELLALTSVVTTNNMLQTSVAIVIKGGAPPVGSLLIDGDGFEFSGRVLSAVERNGHSLIKLESIGMMEAFKRVSFAFSTDRMLMDGAYVTPTLPIQLMQNASVSLPERAGAYARGEDSAVLAMPPSFGDACNTRPLTTTANPLFNFAQPGLDVAGTIGVEFYPRFVWEWEADAASDRPINRGKFGVGGTAYSTFEAKVGITPLAASFNLKCTLYETQLFIPDTLHPFVAAMNALARPQFNIDALFEMNLSIEGGPSVSVVYNRARAYDRFVGATYDVYEQNGQQVRGWRAIDEFTNDDDPKKDLSANLPDILHDLFVRQKSDDKFYIYPDLAFDDWAISFNVGPVLQFDLGVQLLGTMIDQFKNVLRPDEYRELRNSLFVSLVKYRIGVQIQIEWGTTSHVLLGVVRPGPPYWAKQQLHVPYSLEIGLNGIIQILTRLQIPTTGLGFSIAGSIPLVETYKRLGGPNAADIGGDPAHLEFNGRQTSFVWKNDTVKVVSTPTEDARWPFHRGEVYYLGEQGEAFSSPEDLLDQINLIAQHPVARLEREGDQLVGAFEIDKAWPNRRMCRQEGQKMTFHIMGFNYMYFFPPPIFGAKPGGGLETSTYVGSIQVTCSKLKVDIIMPPLLQQENATELRDDPNRPAFFDKPEAQQTEQEQEWAANWDWPKQIPVVYACDDPNNEYDQRNFTAEAHAFDNQAGLTELDFVFGARKREPGGDGVSDLHATITHDFSSSNEEYHPVYAFAYAKRPKLNAQGQPTGEFETIERRVYRPFFMIYRNCGNLEDHEFRSLPVFCETLLQERVRIGRLVSPPGGVPMVVFPRWDDQAHPWRTIGRVPGNVVCMWLTRSDPHITTIDGFHLDSFSLGEFTYLKPRPGYEQGGVIVQARQQRVSDVVVSSSMIGGVITLNLADWTSWNTAVAIKADNTVFELRAGQLLQPIINGQRQTLEPGLHSFGAVDLAINSASSVELRYGNARFRISDHWGAWIDIESTVAQDDSHYGMSGRPNGNIEDDFLWPDGTPATDAYDFANGWRITTAEESLFTYDAGKGPHTYNLKQDAEPPSRQELEPYMDEARTLLAGSCQSDNIPDVEIRNVATELAVGRIPEEIAQTGLCFYYLNGTVTNQLVPGLPVPGARISVLNGDTVVCETWTDRYGRYSCHTPSTGQTGSLTVRVSGRGAASTAVAITALPPAGGYTGLTHDFTVAPTTLQLNGRVSDQTGQPLYNAELRVSGPADAGFTSSYTTTTATGQYTTYMMLDDGVLAGDLTFKLTFSPDFRTDPDAESVTKVVTRPFSGMAEHALNVVPNNLTLSGVMLRFSGRVSFQFSEAVAVEGARVIITPTAPHPEFDGCDITTLVFVPPSALSADRPLDPRKETTDPTRAGTYVCNVPLESLAPFEVTVSVIGRSPAQVIASQTVQVSPALRPAGEVFNVVTPLRVATPVLRLQGRVRSPQDLRLSGAELRATSDQAILDSVAVSDVSGAYTMYLPLDQNVTNGAIDYALSYLNVGTSGSATFSGASVSQPLTITKDFVVRGSKLEFQGRVIDTRTNTPVLGASVLISSPDDPLFCETETGLGGLTPDVYLEPPSPFDVPPVPKICKRVVGRNDPQLMRVVYDVATPWDQRTYTDTIALPAVGGYRFVGRDFSTQSITPTFLELRGRVTRPSGAPLIGASVEAAAAGAGASGATDSNGVYTMTMTLPHGVLSGTLDYTVRYRTLSVTDTAAFSAVQYATTPITRDVLYTPRTVYFRGVITNTYGVKLPPTSIVISSTAITGATGTRCFTQTAQDGTYVCVAQTTATGPISLTYTMSGLWGRYNVTESATIDSSQDVVAYTKDIAVDLTVLRAVGRVATPAGEPLEGVEITPSGNDVYRVETHKTGADGRYDFYIVLRPRTSPSWSGELNYLVGYGEEGRITRVPYVATLNQSTTVARDFTLDMRVVQFKGDVINSFVPADRQDKGVVGTRVTVSSPQIGRLCEYSPLDRYAKSTYDCSARVFTDQPFAVEYLLSGDWGTATITGTVASVPAPGERLTVERPLLVRPATALLSGRVTDRDGRPLGGIAVTIDATGFTNRLVGDRLVRQIEVSTQETGWYTSYVVLNPAVGNTVLDYDVEYRFDGRAYALDAAAALTIVPNTLLPVRTNFRYDYRKVTFKGRLANQTDPAVPLNGTLLIVSPSLNRTLCPSLAASTASDFSCDALIDTDAPYLVNYRVTGAWGATNLLNQSVPGAQTVVTQTVPIAPRLLRLAGRVTAPGGRPLAGAKIAISSYSIINGQLIRLAATSDASGAYSVTSVLADGVTQSAINYRLSLGSYAASRDASFTFDATNLIATATQDFEISASTMTFTGSLINSLMGTGGSWSAGNQIVVSSPTLGRLCASNNLSGTFECTGVVATEQPFNVEYAIFADWGSRVLTDRVALVPQFGGSGVWTSTLAITPTMLRLSGTALLTDGVRLTPFSQAQIRTAIPGVVSSPLVSSVWSSPGTAVSGTFGLDVVLKEIDAPATGTLSLVFQSNDRGPYIRQHTYTASPGVINQSATGTLVFGGPAGGSGNPSTSRTIILRGNFINAIAPDAPSAQPRAYYRLESPTLGTICAYDNPMEPPLGAYYCPVSVDTTEPFEVTVYAWGPYGQAERTFEVTSIPPVGATSTVVQPVQYTLTTVRLSGFVFEPTLIPTPLNNVQVEVVLKRAPKTLATLTKRTAPNGTYEMYAAFGPDVASGPTDLEFSLDLDGIKAKYVIPRVQITSGRLNDLSYGLPFEKRRVRFAGTVTNQLVPGMGVQGTIFVTRPNFAGDYCSAVINPETGYYFCDAILEDSQPISVSYRINGDWGSADFTGRVENIAGVGSTTLAERHMQVAPTTLRLIGTVSDSYGKRLGNARLAISGTGMAYAGPRGDDTLDLVTDAQGNYEAFVLLRLNVTRGDLNYNLQYFNITQPYTRPFFGMVLNTLNEQRQDFELSFRNVDFSGRVRNEYAPGIGMLGDISISSPAGGEMCATELDDGSDHAGDPQLYIGEYRCLARGVDVESTPITYTVSGDWGRLEVADALPFSPVGGTYAKLKNLAAQPTSLLLTGTLRDGLDNPLPGATIRISSGDFSSVSTAADALIDAQGRYTATVVLKQDVISGTLAYQVTVGANSASLVAPFSASAGQLTPINRSIVFARRTVNFSGFVRNGLDANRPLAGAALTMADQSGAPLCSASSAGSGAYACSSTILNNAAVPFRAVVSGDWGSGVISDTIPAGPSNTTTAVSRTLVVSPTTLRVRGTVRDGLGVPLAGATVAVSGDAISSLTTARTFTTDAQGRYEGLVIVKATHHNAALALRVSYGNAQGTLSAPFIAAPAQITPLTKDIVFETRTVVLSGRVFNSLDPASALANAQGAIATATGGPLCAFTTTAQGGYACSIQLLRNESLDIAYSVGGDWGSSAIAGTIPAGASGSTITVQRDLAASPTTLVVRGTVRDGQGAPLAGVSLSIANAGLSQINPGPILLTDAQGVYSRTLVLKQGVTAGTLVYGLSLGGAGGDTLVPFAVPAGGISVVTRDIAFGPRTLRFTGRVYNTLAPAVGLPDTAVQVRSADGELCATTSAAAGAYACQRAVAEGAGFPIEYALSGQWGTAVLTGTVPATQGGTAVITRDVGLPITTLRLRGRVLDNNGAGIAGATITASSADALVSASATSDAAGNYEAFLALKPGITRTSVAYQVQSMFSSDSRSVAINTINQRALTDVSQNFFFNRRNVVFTGTFYNNWSGAAMPADRMEISTSQTGPLCQATGSAATTLSCTAGVVTNQSFLVTYVVSGAWGLTSRQYWIYPDGTNDDVQANNTIWLEPTTLRLYGVVSDPAGFGRSGATITATSPLFAAPLVTTSDYYGNYNLYPWINSPALSGVISLTASLDGQIVTRPVTLTALQSQRLNTVRTDLSLGLYPPTVAVSPTAIQATLNSGQSAEITLAISNTGQRELDYELYNNGSPSAPWLDAPYRSATLAPGAALTTSVTLDATGLVSGTFSGNLRIVSNDPARSSFLLPVSLRVVGTPGLDLAPAQLDFGSVFVGASLTRTLTLTNTGTANLDLLGVASSAPAFAPTWSAGAITPGATRAVQVRLTPGAAIAYGGTLAITTSAGVYSVPLSGQGALPPTIGVSPGSISAALVAGSSATATLTIANSGSSDLTWQTSLSGSGSGTGFLEGIVENLDAGSAAITALVPNRYAFSEGESGAYISDGGNDMYDTGNYLNTNLASAIPYRNTSVGASAAFGPNGGYFTRKYPGLFVLGASLDGITQFSVTGELGADGSGAFDGTVLSVVFGGVTYRGFVKRVYNAGDPSVNHLIIVPDAPGLAHTFATNTNIDNHTVTGLANSRQLFYLLYASANGGYVNDTQTRAIMVKFLEVARASGWLQGDPGSGTVAPGGSQQLTVTLDASELISGTYAAAVDISSNDPQTPLVSVPVTLSVSGAPAITAAPDPLQFAPLFVGLSATRTLTISNTGTAPLELASVTSDDSRFVVSVAPATIQPGGAIVAQVRFTPTGSGPLTRTLTIAAGALSRTVSVAGTGLLPPIIGVSPGTISAAAPAGSLITRTLTIANTGGSPLTYTLDLGVGSVGGGGALDVVVLGAPSSDGWLNDVVAKLTATGTFNSVARINVSQRTPSLTELQQYDAALVFSDASFSSAAALGDVLADYVDQGGGVVVMTFALGGGPSLGGRFASGGYNVMQPGSHIGGGGQTMGAILQAGHPLLTGVQSFNVGSSGYRSTGNLTAGSAAIVRYADGVNLAADKKIITPLGERRRLDLNFYPPSSTARSDFWLASTDGGRLMANALLYTARPAYTAVTPKSGTVAPGASQQVAVTLDATELISDTYLTSINVRSNDPQTPLVTVPITFSVSGTPVISASASALNFGTVYTGAALTRTLTITNAGSANLNIQSLSSTLGDYSAPLSPTVLVPRQSVSIAVRFTPAAAGDRSASLNIASNAAPSSIALIGAGQLPPVIAFSPAAISASAAPSATLQRTFVISNTGNSPLTYTLELRATAGVPDVAVLGASSTGELNDVVAKLAATGSFNTVTSINVNQRTPGLAELQQYDAVLVFSNYSFASATTLGNVLADYVDWGGGVVVMQFTLGGGSTLAGRFASGGYNVIQPASNLGGPAVTLGAKDRPDHQLLDGVRSFDSGPNGGYRSNGALTAGSLRIASYSDGSLLAADKLVSTSLGQRLRLDLNFYPPSSTVSSGYWQATTDGGRLMANALLAVARPTYAAVTPQSGTVAPGGSATITLAFDTARLEPATYQSRVLIQSNDVVRPRVEIPVSLTVTP